MLEKIFLNWLSDGAINAAGLAKVKKRGLSLKKYVKNYNSSKTFREFLKTLRFILQSKSQSYYTKSIECFAQIVLKHQHT